MRRVAVPYTDAIRWLVLNDDTNWVRDPDPIPSVSACLVADIYYRTTDEVTADLRRDLLRNERKAA